MDRALFKTLAEWKKKDHRKPVVLKGARQVGKSFLVRQAGAGFRNLVEVNFDFRKDLKKIFMRDLDPARITRELCLALNTEISEGETLLFLDEIQECPEAIKSLRYFYEKMPRLHVIAAGSLVDFVLEQTGLPVGRVMPLHLYPLSFMEFLEACDESGLVTAVTSHDPEHPMPDFIHDRLNHLLSEYMATGGMPEAVDTWIKRRDLKEVIEIQRTLIETYRQDFARYAKTIQVKYVDVVYSGIPGSLGKKLVFSSFGPDYRARELRPALELLSKAQVAHRVVHSSCGTVPLAGQSNPAYFKVIMCDVGLVQAMLSMDVSRWILDGDELLAGAGPVAENFIGQEILACGPATERIQLHYWARQKRGASAEVDYVVERKGRILPVEVKSGNSNRVKSLKMLMESKPHIRKGIVFSKNNFSKERGISRYPLYAVSLIYGRT